MPKENKPKYEIVKCYICGDPAEELRVYYEIDEDGNPDRTKIICERCLAYREGD